HHVLGCHGLGGRAVSIRALDARGRVPRRIRRPGCRCGCAGTQGGPAEHHVRGGRVTAAVAAAVIGCGGLAALARYLVALWFSTDDRFPWAVLVVNVIGSALGGVVLGLGGGLDD